MTVDSLDLKVHFSTIVKRKQQQQQQLNKQKPVFYSRIGIEIFPKKHTPKCFLHYK